MLQCLDTLHFCAVLCCTQSLSHVQLFDTTWTVALPPGSSVLGIFQARILEWVATSSSRVLPDPGIKLIFPVSPALQADSLPVEPSEKSLYMG